MSDTEEQDEALGGLEGPVGTSSEESGGGPGLVVEDLEEALPEAAAQSDPEPSNLEEEEEEEEETLEDRALRLGPYYFRMAGLRFLFLGLFRSLLYRLTHNNHVVLHGSDPFSRNQHQGTHSGAPSVHALSLLLSERLNLPPVTEVPTSSQGLNLNMSLAGLPPLPPMPFGLPELPLIVPTIQATQPTLLGIEAATPTNLDQALEPSKPADQTAAAEPLEPSDQAAASREMTQYLLENADEEETQKSGGEEEKEAKEEEDKKNKVEEPEEDLDPGEGTSSCFSCLLPTKDFSSI